MSFFKEIHCRLLEKLTRILPIYPELATLLKASNMNCNDLDPPVLFMFLEILTQLLMYLLRRQLLLNRLSLVGGPRSIIGIVTREQGVPRS